MSAPEHAPTRIRLRDMRANAVYGLLVSPRGASVRVVTDAHERHGDDSLALVFGVDEGSGEVTATVLVGPSGAVRFPHGLTEAGLSLGPVADAALRERAEQTIAVLEAAETYRAIRARL